MSIMKNKQDTPIGQLLLEQGDPLTVLWYAANAAIEDGAQRYNEVTEMIDIPPALTASMAEKVIRQALLVNRHRWAR